MSTFSTEINIQSLVGQVWDVLSDIGSIDRWNPGVVESHVTTTDQQVGLGAGRYCHLGGRNYLNEKVVALEKNRHLTMRITDTNLPLHADIHFAAQSGRYPGYRFARLYC